MNRILQDFPLGRGEAAALSLFIWDYQRCSQKDMWGVNKMSARDRGTTSLWWLFGRISKFKWS